MAPVSETIRAYPTIGICGIFKNECPYILEWVAYHRITGVDEIVVYDNCSDDGSSELLTALEKAGKVRRTSGRASRRFLRNLALITTF